ncbi:hypothetical protein PROFUN_15690 [Planoprotostelium fungivorum]|uniref:Uncharacterized protein n=1 Tax=Planoprotostelium fungivorum TaxID=1890364 RepID=A0A2P6MYX1_9EUKA|nr:hypothetical protein PROFUN_15690 [Planoprotostelium fungivorum]
MVHVKEFIGDTTQTAAYGALQALHMDQKICRGFWTSTKLRPHFVNG